MPSKSITRGGGIQLHVDETGDPGGQPILFLHGFSGSRLAWRRQLESDLATEFRLLAVDLRGHGLSDKPRDAYGDPRLWSDDVQAAIDQLGLDRPILVGHSYAGLPILDYVNVYGQERLGGLVLVGAISRNGSPAASADNGPKLLAAVPKMLSADVEENIQGTQDSSPTTNGRRAGPIQTGCSRSLAAAELAPCKLAVAER